MGMMNWIKKEWKLLKLQTRHDIFGAGVKEERELQALKNLIQVARERVWLTEDARTRAHSTSFSSELSDNERKLITDSAKVVEGLLLKETELRRRYVK